MNKMVLGIDTLLYTGLIIVLSGCAGGAVATPFEPEMVQVPKGCFVMGSPIDEMGRDVDETQVDVCLNGFSLAKREVTRSQFSAFIEATGYVTDAEKDPNQRGCWSFQTLGDTRQWGWFVSASWKKPWNKSEIDGNLPVSCVSYQDAQAFIKWINLKTNKLYRLPTESEWEYAARGTSKSTSFWQVPDEACKFANIADISHGVEGNFPCDDGFKEAAITGSLIPNKFGLYDMLGNVWEWTCSEGRNKVPDSSQKCTKNAQFYISKGSSWDDTLQSVRFANKSSIPRNIGIALQGFRLAMD